MQARLTTRFEGKTGDDYFYWEGLRLRRLSTSTASRVFQADDCPFWRVSMRSPQVVTGDSAILTCTRDRVLPALRHALRELHPDLAAVASYHCGLTDQFGQPYKGSGGKMLRPALVFLAADTARPQMSAWSDTVVAGAVAVQLVHEFSLLHDDIMDRDRTRRGRPTAWTVYGIDRALLCGDGLLALAMAGMTSQPECSEVLADALIRLCSGQADDIAYTARLPTVADWERMAAGKTGALLAASCHIGGLLAEADPGTATVLCAVGTHLGLAFQAVDDRLGIWGDPTITGKPAGADLAARKRSLPIVITLNTPGAGEDLQALLASDRNLTADEIQAANILLDQAEASERTRQYADQQLTSALDALDTLAMIPDLRREWDMLANFLTSRTT